MNARSHGMQLVLEISICGFLLQSEHASVGDHLYNHTAEAPFDFFVS